jgi:glycosyltransferase involved in cell wall biosynthesis
MPLRILHSLSTLNPAAGGPVEGVHQLTRRNLLLGHVVEFVTLDDPDSPWLKNIPVKVHALGPTSLGIYGFTPRYVPWLREHAHNYDCVVVNGIWNFNSFGTWLGLHKPNVPYFVFTHGMLDPWFKHRYPLKHLKKLLYWPWGGYPVLRDAHAVFFTCEEERVLARESFWLYDCHEFVLRYGTAGLPWPPETGPKEEFLAAHPSLRGKRLFTFLGRVHPKKGPDLLIKAVAALIERGIWDRGTMRVVMAGPVNGAYAATLRHLIERLGVQDVFYWTDMLLGSQKWGVLQASEVMVLPSHQENFGLVVAESLSTGTPVLLAKGVNIWRDIVDDCSGLADEDTAKGCERILKQWIELRPDEQAAMGLRARACYETRYTAESAANTFVAALYLLISVHKNQRWQSSLPTATSVRSRSPF